MEKKSLRKTKDRPVVETEVKGEPFVMENRQIFQPPSQIDFRIPNDLLKQYQGELRIVVRYPWIIGIPIPDWLLKNPELLGRAGEEFEPMLIPKSSMR